MYNTLKYLVKIVILLIIHIFLFCTKNSTNPNDEIVKPEIVYISEFEVPVAGNGYTIYRALTIIDANGDNRRNIFTVNRGNLLYPNYSMICKKIVFVMYSDTSEQSALYLIGVNGNNLLQISEKLSNYFTTAFISPQFLSDGIHIVYTRRVDWDKYEIRKINSETGNDILIADGNFGATIPEITMNDELIISLEDGILYKMSRDGSTLDKITSGNVNASEFYLNKQTNEMVFRCYHPDTHSTNIAKISIDGSGFVDYNFSGQFPRISLDGSRIIYHAMGEAEPSIWIANSDGNNAHVLTSNFTWDSYCQFFPDGNRILFVREVNDYYAIFSCNINGNNIQQLSKIDFMHCWPVFIP